jgi:hypothetical protein
MLEMVAINIGKKRQKTFGGIRRAAFAVPGTIPRKKEKPP